MTVKKNSQARIVHIHEAPNILVTAANGDTVEMAKDAIMLILNAAHCNDKTKRAALSALDSLTGIKNNSFSNMTFHNGEQK